MEEAKATLESDRRISRRHDLDALRATAMLLGIALHAALSFVAFAWVVQDNQQARGFGIFFVALHGFRMPLFFLVSGFFTAMLWRTRGLQALISQRTRRIAVPFALACLTIIPLMNYVIDWAGRSAPMVAEVGVGSDPTADVWKAAKIGDVQTLRARLDEGADINALDTKMGQTPLGMAALFGRAGAARLLLERGAPASGRTADGNTPLHHAAFLGHVDIARLLLAAGADLSLKNKDGATPLESLKAPWGLTQFIATLVGVRVKEAEVMEARETISTMFQEAVRSSAAREGGANGSALGQATSAAGPGVWLKRAFTTPFLHHLWFLWMLCWLVAGFAAMAWVADRLRGRGAEGSAGMGSRWLGWLVLSPARWLWLVPLTMVFQAMMGSEGPSFGPDTSLAMLPLPHVLMYYAIFFGFGALYYLAGDAQGRVGRWWWLLLVLALVVVFPIGLASTFDPGKGEYAAVWKWVSVATQVMYAWMMSFGLMGLFRRLCAKERPAIRYISDSAYWLYLAHLPLILVAQVLVREWEAPALVKFVVVCASVTGVLLVSYEYLIRYTWVGHILHGPRTRRSGASV